MHRSTSSGCVTAHSMARMPPIEPPTTAAPARMPRRSASATLGRHLVADGDVREPAPPGLPVRGRGAGPVRALAAAEHVGGDDEPLVGVDRCARADEAVPPAGRCVPRPASPTTWLSPVRACSTSTTLSPASLSLPHVSYAMRTSGSTPPRSSSTSPMAANWRSPTGSPSRQAPSGPALPAPRLVAAVRRQGPTVARPDDGGAARSDGAVPAAACRAGRRELCFRWVTVIGGTPGPRACTHPGRARPGPHPGHPTAKEGCRPASRGLSLVLVTWSNHTRDATRRRSTGPRHGRPARPVRAGGFTRSGTAGCRGRATGAPAGSAGGRARGRAHGRPPRRRAPRRRTTTREPRRPTAAVLRARPG